MKICLNMIVKNESHVIERCLNSVKPYISHFIISDTGSTDNTIDIIEKTLSDIPGKVYNHVWEDFSTNRNIALDLARDKADYILFIDADDFLITNNSNYIFYNLKDNCYGININDNDSIHPRICLINNNWKSKYRGVVHEEIIPPNNDILILDNCFIKYTGEGNRSKNINKYLNDAKLLEIDLSKNYSLRTIYYIGQSYRDAYNLNPQDDFLKKAIYYFKLRLKYSGNVTELYNSQLFLNKFNCI